MLRRSLKKVTSLTNIARRCQTSSKLPSTPVAGEQVTRESCLRDITDVEPVSKMDKRMLVLTMAYKTTAEIPDIIPSHKIRRCRDLMRVIVGSILTLMFIVAVPFYIASGKKARASGDTVWRQKKEWIRELREKKAAEDAQSLANGCTEIAATTASTTSAVASTSTN